MRAVNLLPDDARPQQQRFTFGSTLAPNRVLQGGGAAIALVVVLFGFLYVHGRSVVHSKQQTLATTQAQLASAQARVAKVEATRKEAQARFRVVTSIVSTRMNWDGTLLDLAKVLPSGVYLSSLSASAATSSIALASAAPSSFTISGSAPSYVSTASVLDRLAVLPWLTGITLQSTTRQPQGSVQFNVQGTVRGGAQ